LDFDYIEKIMKNEKKTGFEYLKKIVGE